MGEEVLLDVRNLSPRIAGGIRKKTKPQRRTDGGTDLAYCSRKRAGKRRNRGGWLEGQDLPSPS